MATYNTIAAADVEAEQSLVNNAPKRNVKLLIGGAAVAAFVLGALAATAVTSSPGLRGADFSSSSDDLVQIADAKYNNKCMEVQGEAKEGAKIVVRPCANGGPYQITHYNEKKGEIRFKFEGDEFCVDALGGGSFRPGGNIGLYKCKRGDKNSEWSHTSEQAITLRSKFDGKTLCMNHERAPSMLGAARRAALTPMQVSRGRHSGT